MQVPLLILDTLDELGTDDFKRFRWNLTQQVLDECQPIRKGHLENADKQDTVSRMIDSYGEETAVNITVEILRRMNHNNAAQKLKQAYAGGSTGGSAGGSTGGSAGGSAGGSTAAQKTDATPPSSSSAVGLTPAAGASVCAQGKSVIVAPNISGTSSGVSINMNINTK